MNYYNGMFSTISEGERQLPEIKLHIVFPATILSLGFEVENRTKHRMTLVLEEGDPAQTSDQVAAAAIRELKWGKAMVTTHGKIGDRPFLDTVLGWVVGVLWFFIGCDVERKVWKVGVEEASLKDVSRETEKSRGKVSGKERRKGHKSMMRGFNVV